MPDIIFHEDETAEDWRRLGRRLETTLNENDQLKESIAAEIARRQKAEANAADLGRQVDRQRVDISVLTGSLEAWQGRAERAEKLCREAERERDEANVLLVGFRDELARQLGQRSRLFTLPPQDGFEGPGYTPPIDPEPQTVARADTGAQHRDERLVPREPARGEQLQD